MSPSKTIVRRLYADGVGEVVFDGPANANALHLESWRELRAAFEDMDGRRDIRAVVLRGEGRGFCAGIDLSLLAALASDTDACQGRSSEDLFALISELQDTVTAIERCRKPVIASIHGACIGGGVDIACAVDIRLTTETARFCVKETALAVIPDLGTIQRLPGIVGAGIARELIFTARPFDGAEAGRIRFANHVFPDEQSTRAAAIAMARQIGGNAPVAVRGAKENILFSENRPLQEGLRHVALLNAARLRSADFAEAGASLREKRPAKYRD